jgi:hypothetical protein
VDERVGAQVNGEPIVHDGAFALDPTNPGVLNRARLALSKFRALGVRYVKIDFITTAPLRRMAGSTRAVRLQRRRPRAIR